VIINTASCHWSLVIGHSSFVIRHSSFVIRHCGRVGGLMGMWGVVFCGLLDSLTYKEKRKKEKGRRKK